MNEKTIWNYLIAKIGNPYGVAGLMGNLYAESALNPTNLQGSYEKKLGMTDEGYTAGVDNGRYTNFVHDSAGYGLAQWTYWSRKQALLTYAREQGKSIGDLDMQLGFLWKEIQTYKGVMSVLTGAKTVKEASDKVLTGYEKPANQGDSVKQKRASYGQKYFEQFANTSPAEEPEETQDQEQEEAAIMGFDRQKVIDIALNEEGYLEKASNKDLDSKTGNAGSKNYTKYARDMDAIPGFYNGKKQGAAWCDIFVDWCFVQAYGVDDGRALLCQPTKSAGAGCKYSRQYYKAKGRLFDSPEPGDQIFFYPSDGIGGSAIQHTGLVYKVDNTYVYTVEGNTSGASGVVANGGGVAKKKYKLNYNRIAGYGRPNYSVGTTIQPTPTQPEPEKPENGQETKGKTVVVTASSVNVRVGNGTDFSRITAVSKGTMLEWVATAENGWHAVVYKKQVAWISGKYAEVRG